jgi:hypothetical protein
MIDIERLTEEDKGRWVTYFPGYLKADGTPFYEVGKIKSWNDKVIFVVFHVDGNWNNYKDYTAAGTRPEDLVLGDLKEKIEGNLEEKIKEN